MSTRSYEGVSSNDRETHQSRFPTFASHALPRIPFLIFFLPRPPPLFFPPGSADWKRPGPKYRISSRVKPALGSPIPLNRISLRTEQYTEFMLGNSLDTARSFFFSFLLLSLRLFLVILLFFPFSFSPIELTTWRIRKRRWSSIERVIS